MERQGVPDVRRLVAEWGEGDEATLDRLVPLVYAELHAIASRQLGQEHAAATLQTTALIHEAYLRLIGTDVQWEGRKHFLAIAARTMRRVLVDKARARQRIKRGSGAEAVTLTDGMAAAAGDMTDVIAVDEALERLAAHDERKARVVELHFFGGFSYDEIADLVGTSAATVDRDLRFAVAWLRAAMRAD
jgi:RNA polymerase sigma-70 factor (ECF subfamily)